METRITRGTLHRMHMPMREFKKLPEYFRAELIDNIVCEPPQPSFGHQNVLVELTVKLHQFLEANKPGIVVVGPFGVYLDEKSNAVEPDITVILKGNPGELKHGFHGAPDFLIELLSPSNRRHDLVVKKELYRKFGVKEYWIINPLTKEVTGYALKNGKYSALPVRVGEIRSPLLGFHTKF